MPSNDRSGFTGISAIPRSHKSSLPTTIQHEEVPDDSEEDDDCSNMEKQKVEKTRSSILREISPIHLLNYSTNGKKNNDLTRLSKIINK